MVCPKCGNDTKVIDSREDEMLIAVNRRRECRTCAKRFNTVEITAEWFETLNEMASRQVREEEE